MSHPKELTRMLEKFYWESVPTHHNEHQTWEVVLESGVHMRMALFDPYCHPWIHLDIGFGEVRNIWGNHTPLGERGMLDASFTPSDGHWRFCLVAPKSRTHLKSGQIFDLGSFPENVFELEKLSETNEGHTEDLTTSVPWDRSKIGY